MSSFAGQRALVVGATGGIGREYVQDLIDEGADVALTYHANREAAESLVARGASVGRPCVAVSLNLRDRQSIAEGVEKILADFGPPTIVVNCAGVLHDVPFLKMKPEHWDAVLEINLTGPVQLLRALAPAMVRNGGGRIVNVASVSGLFGPAGQANYAASKGGIIAFTRAAARELGGLNITVNAVAPGLVETEMTTHLSERQRRKLLERIPLRRFATARDVVRASHVLMRADTAYVNGQVLVIDGGMTA
jgi:3-oxoacyl-[acyl-carrier protein] reductase